MRFATGAASARLEEAGQFVAWEDGKRLTIGGSDHLTDDRSRVAFQGTRNFGGIHCSKECAGGKQPERIESEGVADEAALGKDGDCGEVDAEAHAGGFG